MCPAGWRETRTPLRAIASPYSAKRIVAPEPRRVRSTRPSLFAVAILNASVALPQAPVRTDSARVVLLGTGSPVPDPERSGPGLAIVVKGASYLVDAGPGIVRRATASALRDSIPA